MNENPRALEERLTAATAGELVPGALLDHQTASLRETWLALGELLDSADAALDEQVVLRQVRQQARRRQVRRRLWQAAAVAVAASLLVGAAVAWRWTGADPPKVASGEHQKKATATAEHLAAAETEPQDVDFDWNDPLDTEIASAGEDIRRAEQRWGRRGGLVDVLWEQMQELEQGMSGESL